MNNPQNTTGTPELALPTVSRCGAGAMRLVPVGGDTMEPTLKRGDAVAVVPVSAFSHDSLYVVGHRHHYASVSVQLRFSWLYRPQQRQQGLQLASDVQR